MVNCIPKLKNCNDHNPEVKITGFYPDFGDFSQANFALGNLIAMAVDESGEDYYGYAKQLIYTPDYEYEDFDNLEYNYPIKMV